MKDPKAITQRIEVDGKDRITITIDRDVSRKLEEIAMAQRSKVSPLVNRILAEKMGLIPEDEA